MKPEYGSMSTPIQIRATSEGFQTASKKDSESGRRMYELLKDGESHNLIVKIRFLPNGAPSGNVVLIEDLISDNWLE